MQEVGLHLTLSIQFFILEVDERILSKIIVCKEKKKYYSQWNTGDIFDQKEVNSKEYNTMISDEFEKLSYSAKNSQEKINKSFQEVKKAREK